MKSGVPKSPVGKTVRRKDTFTDYVEPDAQGNRAERRLHARQQKARVRRGMEPK